MPDSQPLVGQTVSYSRIYVFCRDRGSALLFGFTLCAVALGISFRAQAQTRNFRMGLWDSPSGADADLAFFSEMSPQPAGHSILQLGSWHMDGFASYWAAMIAQQHYDFSRIEAVLVDEPYWGTMPSEDWSNPCRNPSDPRNSIIQDDYARLVNVARVVRSTSLTTRFWINFSEPEVQWMMDSECPVSLNGSHVDVVSMDVYWKPFSTGLRAYYDWIVAHRAYPGQQSALVPGTFFRDPGDDPFVNASLLQGFFDYANGMNQRCDLPLGASGMTGNSDGCLVWMVAGWTGMTWTGTGVTWRGEHDPASGLIQSVWQAQLATPRPHRKKMNWFRRLRYG